MTVIIVIASILIALLHIINKACMDIASNNNACGCAIIFMVNKDTRQYIITWKSLITHHRHASYIYMHAVTTHHRHASYIYMHAVTKARTQSFVQ